MATFLFAWELGYGLGHLVNLQPLVKGLRNRGHRVELVLRDLAKARAVFGDHPASAWQAPFKQQRTKHLGPTLSFAHILYENGFCDAVELEALGGAWRNIYRAIDADVMVFDHSPTALLAARGTRAKRVTLGTGFFLPLDTEPMPCLQPWLKADPVRLLADERQVLAAANTALQAWGELPLARLSQLFHPSDEHLLVTFAELDHYGTRPGATYRGAWPGGFGKPPQWPAVSGKRIYAYLKPFPQLAALLEVLQRSGQPTIVYGSEIPAELRASHASASLRFETEPLDMEAVGRQCDLAILNANHGTVTSILRAGKPSLQIPIYVEQSMLAMALARLGVSLAAPPDRAAEIELQFRKLLSDSKCAEEAQKFAKRYAAFEPQQQIAEILARLEELAA